jgi:2-polyprenyl-3-methyl-5-hydroxy-6-metoxy-1,4-benzoquinol methylase
VSNKFAYRFVELLPKNWEDANKIMQEKNYVFASTNKELERNRLEILQRIFDPFTQQNLNNIGLDRGWHCLEVGCGAGSIMNWLVDRVGDSGKVTAVDLDTRFVEDITKPNLEIRQCDIAKDELEKEAYDLIHTRVVLMHVIDRSAALNNMLAALKPNGWLLLEEASFSTTTVREINEIDRSIIERVFAASQQMLIDLGADPFLGNLLPYLLQNNGMKNISNATNINMFQGSSDRAKIWQMAIAQTMPKLLKTQLVDRTELDRFLDLIDRENIWMMDYAMVATWGQKQ